MYKAIYFLILLGGAACAILSLDTAESPHAEASAAPAPAGEPAPAAATEAPRAEASAPPAPVAAPRYDQLVITASEFKKNEYGTVEGALGLENLSDGDIKDVVFRYDSIAASGTVLKTYRTTLYRMVPAHSKTAFSITPVVPFQTDTVRFEIESYTQTH